MKSLARSILHQLVNYLIVLIKTLTPQIGAAVLIAVTAMLLLLLTIWLNPIGLMIRRNSNPLVYKTLFLTLQETPFCYRIHSVRLTQLSPFQMAIKKSLIWRAPYQGLQSTAQRGIGGKPHQMDQAEGKIISVRRVTI